MVYTWRMNKFGAQKTEYSGRVFDSLKEARYAHHLDILKKASLPKDRVTSVQYQVPYEIAVNGKQIGKYILDFKAEYADGHVECVDVKGYKKGASYNLFLWKKRLVEALHGIRILEV